MELIKSKSLLFFRQFVSDDSEEIYEQLKQVIDSIADWIKDGKEINMELVVDIVDMIEQVQFYLTTTDFNVEVKR